MVKCCFTSTETVGLSGTGAQDGHLDFHTVLELLLAWTVCSRAKRLKKKKKKSEKKCDHREVCVANHKGDIMNALIKIVLAGLRDKEK